LNLNLETTAMPKVKLAKKKIQDVQVAPEQKQRTSRYWVWTSYAPALTPEWENKNFQYMVYQPEVCPSTGRLHFQGYLEVIKPIRWKKATKIISDAKAWVRIREGTREAARAYCMKDESRAQGETFIELGEWKEGEPGHRYDIDAMVKDIPDMKWEDLIDKHPDKFLKYGGRMKQLYDHHHRKDIVDPNNFRAPHVQVLIGDPRSGKTKKAWELAYASNEAMFTLSAAMAKKDGTIWFDGYVDQPILLIDDFDGWIPFRSLLTMLDRYPCKLQTKGSTVEKNWYSVFITSNKSPEDWYPTEDCTPLWKRIAYCEVYLDDHVETIDGTGPNRLTLDMKKTVMGHVNKLRLMSQGVEKGNNGPSQHINLPLGNIVTEDESYDYEKYADGFVVDDYGIYD